MGLLKNAMVSMGLAQAGPKITPQDKAILECVFSLTVVHKGPSRRTDGSYYGMLTVKSQGTTRQDEAVSETGQLRGGTMRRHHHN